MVYRLTQRGVEQRATRRAAVLEAAIRCVAEVGFTGARISTVAARAEVGTGTVYRYFGDKAALMSAVFQTCAQREVDAMGAALAGEGDCRTRLHRGCVLWASRAIDGNRLAWALIAEPVEAGIAADRLRFREAYAQQIAALISEGVATGDFAAQDPRLSAACIVGALAEALVGPLWPGAARPPSEPLIEDLAQFCLRAVCAHP